MFAEKVRDFQAHLVSLETLVPANNFYRQLEAKLDLNFVRDWVGQLYKPFGRPGIDPVVFFKLQLIMFFEGIRSERQLMETVSMRLDHRWYIGYDLHQPVPDHSSLSKIRDRYGLAIFQRFFERIVELCIEAGLVWGQELYFDATQVRANADIDSMVQRVNLQLLPPMAQMETETAPIEASTHSRNLLDKYDGKRIPEQKQMSSYQRVTDAQVSLTDADASPMKPGFVGPARLGYQTHYVVDGGKARIILATLVAPASVMENTPMLDLARWSRFRWQLHAKIAVADAMYDTGYNVANLELDGLQAYIASRYPEQSQKDAVYHRRLFTFDADNNRYICPQGQELSYKFTSMQWQAHFYRAKKRVCDQCPVHEKCREGKRGRSIRRSIYQEYLDQAESHRQTPAYAKAMRKRQVWIEPKFGEVKQWHQGRQFRLRGLQKVNIEALLKAAGQNIKQFLKRKQISNHPQPPISAVGLQQYPFCFF